MLEPGGATHDQRQVAVAEAEIEQAVGIGLVLDRIEVRGIEAAVLPAVDQPGKLPRGPALLVEILGLDQLLEQAQLIIGVHDRIV